MGKKIFEVAKMTQEAADYLASQGYVAHVGNTYRIYLIGYDHDRIGLEDEHGNEYPTFPASMLGLNIEEIRQALIKRLQTR